MAGTLTAGLVRAARAADKAAVGAIGGILTTVLDYALPPRCPGCGAITADPHRFCLDCWQALEFVPATACRTCAEPLELLAAEDGRCAACVRQPPAIDGMRAVVAYGEIARQIAIRLKHGRRPGLAITMGRLMARHVDAGTAPLLVPVPLHRGRLWWRGFNQSALIARAMARETGAEVAVMLLRRVKPTPMLRGLGPPARARTVAGAFRVRPEDRAALAGRAVLLIDDVHTSGATANACARTLKRAGAGEVRLSVWARVARGGGDRR